MSTIERFHWIANHAALYIIIVVGYTAQVHRTISVFESPHCMEGKWTLNSTNHYSLTCAVIAGCTITIRTTSTHTTVSRWYCSETCTSTSRWSCVCMCVVWFWVGGSRVGFAPGTPRGLSCTSCLGTNYTCNVFWKCTRACMKRVHLCIIILCVWVWGVSLLVRFI